MIRIAAARPFGWRGDACQTEAMTDKPSNPTSEALKRALAAKKAGTPAGLQGGHAVGGQPEKAMQRQAMAMNKPAFRKASKRG